MSPRARRILAIAAGLIAAAALRVLQVQGARIEPDELQHLHAAWLVATGQRPYVDFFEHHTPLFYFLGGGLIVQNRAGFHTILFFRWLGLGSHVLVIALATSLAASVGVEAGVAAFVLLLAEIFSFAWGTTVLLDSFAAPLVLLSALVLARRPASLAAHVLAGALLGAAIGLTQKAAWAAAAPVLLIALRVPFGGGHGLPRARGEIAAFGLGLLVAAAPLAWLLGAEGGRAFFQDVVALNAAWKARRRPLGEAFIMASYGAPIWLPAAAGLLGAVSRLVRERRPLHPVVATAGAYLACLLGGAVLMPVVWYEYFVEVGPFAAVVAALVLTDLGRAAGLLGGEPLCLPQGRGILRAGIVGLTGTTALSVVLRVWNDHYCPTVAPTRLVLSAVAATLCALAAQRAIRRRAGRRAALALLLLLSVFPLVNQLEWLRRTGIDTQRTGIEYVLAHTVPGDRVFDGYSGFGVFRAHAYRYWFLHDEMQLMLSPAERGTDVVHALEDPRVKVAIRDEYVRLLEPEVTRYLDARFRPARDIIWLRREGARE